tara:strand:+ start:1234 stop:1494 length:261 start_codon:yes stop_codon:yes gene_type:complete
LKALPQPPEQYDRQQMDEAFKILETEDKKNVKTNSANIFMSGGAMILQSADGDFWRLTVDNDGTLGTASVPVDSDGSPVTSINPYV